MVHAFPASRARWLAPLALILAACRDMGPSRSLSLSVTAKSVATASLPAAPGLNADIVVGSGTSAITISKVQVVMSEIELSTGGSCSSTGEHDNCDELEVGPVPVDVPVDGTTKVFLDKVVPPGTYTALEAKVDSVMVTFTDANNQAHDFKLALGEEAEIEAAFQTPVTVDATTSNLTINVDVASWFKDATGAVLDPTNPVNASLIRQNILRSFHAFEDDNHDGEDDDSEGGGDL
jgi:hypothetical protein